MAQNVSHYIPSYRRPFPGYGATNGRAHYGLAGRWQMYSVQVERTALFVSTDGDGVEVAVARWRHRQSPGADDREHEVLPMYIRRRAD